MDLERSIESIMTSDVEVVSPSQALVDVKHIYEKEPFHHHIPVVEDGKLIGVLSLIDFMRHIHYASMDDNEVIYTESKVSEIMVSNPTTIAPSTSVREAVQILSQGHIHSLLIAENGELKGIVTTADLMKLMLQS